MQPGEAIKVKFSRFKRKLEFDFGEHGIVLEKLGGGICLYVTDVTHEDIHCVAPLGFDKEFKDVSYYIYSVDENRAFFRVRRAVLFIDFEGKFCSTNVENFKVIGAPDWGQDCLVPWKDAYTKLYNSAENKRTGKTAADETDAESKAAE